METSLTVEAQELKQHIHDLEKQLLSVAIAWARDTYKQVLEQLDRFIQKHRSKAYTIEHKRTTWYRTWLGHVQITRRQYRSPEGEYHYFLDELMGMRKYRHITASVQEIALELAGNMSFRRSSEILRQTTAIDLSAQTIHRILRRVADSHIENADSQTKRFEATGEIPQVAGKRINRLLIEADGVMLSLQRELARKAEVKLGIAYEGWQKVGKDRYSTLNKMLYADIAGSDEFWAGMTIKLHGEYDLGSIKQVVIGGDGATWIKDGVDYYGGRYQLCRYHLNRELCYAMGQDHQALRLIQRHCSNGEIDSALALLQEAANKAAHDKAIDIKRAIRYLNSNVSGLLDYRLDSDHADGVLRRTGAIEGNVDKVIVRRMKNQGMSWTRKGIRRMLWLRIKLHEKSLATCLQRPCNESLPTKIPIKRMNQVIDRTLKKNYPDYFTAGLPALYGPHSARPWVEMLKSLTRMAA